MAYGFVLVGGLSTRMGRDKALLPVGGVPMALLQARKLERVCGRAAFVGKDPGALAALGYPFVADGTAEHGGSPRPPRGARVVPRGARRRPRRRRAARPGGAPRGAPGAPRGDGRDRPSSRRTPGIPQPLCAAWTKAALPALRLAVAAGDLSLRRAVEAARAVVLSEEETARLPGFVAGAFRNVNTPEDYRAVEEETA